MKILSVKSAILGHWFKCKISDQKPPNIRSDIRYFESK